MIRAYIGQPRTCRHMRDSRSRCMDNACSFNFSPFTTNVRRGRPDRRAILPGSVGDPTEVDPKRTLRYDYETRGDSVYSGVSVAPMCWIQALKRVQKLSCGSVHRPLALE